MGTSLGRIVTFQFLPEASGGYSVKFAGATSLGDFVVAITAIDADSGAPASASPEVVGGLRTGHRVNGIVLASTSSGARLFKPPSAKGASKSWDHCLLYSAAVVRFEAHTYCLLGLYGDGSAKAFSLPGLKEIASTSISDTLDVKRLAEAIITPTGFIFGWTGPSEITVLNIWGTGQDL